MGTLIMKYAAILSLALAAAIRPSLNLHILLGFVVCASGVAVAAQAVRAKSMYGRRCFAALRYSSIRCCSSNRHTPGISPSMRRASLHLPYLSFCSRTFQPEPSPRLSDRTQEAIRCDLGHSVGCKIRDKHLRQGDGATRACAPAHRANLPTVQRATACF